MKEIFLKHRERSIQREPSEVETIGMGLSNNGQFHFLSVIIPTRDRAALLIRALESLKAQTYSQKLFEVIIIDNGSSDITRQVCQEYEKEFINFKYIYDCQPGLHVGRHRGMSAAEGEILVYGDDDICASPTWLEGISDGFSRDDIVLVGGKILPDLEVQEPEWYRKIWNYCRWGKWLGCYSLLDFGNSIIEIPAHFIWGCNFSIRKHTLIEVGGFHPDSMPKSLIKYRGDGETAVSHAVTAKGYKSLYHPKATVSHWVSKERLTPIYLYQRAYAQGISDSYTHIRSGIEPHQKKEFISSNEMVKDVIAKGHVDGFNFHQREARSDKWLLRWIRRPSYIPGRHGEKKINMLVNRLAQYAIPN